GRTVGERGGLVARRRGIDAAGLRHDPSHRRPRPLPGNPRHSHRYRGGAHRVLRARHPPQSRDPDRRLPAARQRHRACRVPGHVRVVACGAFMIIGIGLVALVATGYAVDYMRAELHHGHTTARGARIYGILVQAFLAAMLSAVVVDNLGVLWVAVEATTIATA